MPRIGHAAGDEDEADSRPLIPFSTYRCPNEPPCPHPALAHDIEDYDAMQPVCCADGCTCGRANTFRD
jgi:hypothetical protein